MLINSKASKVLLVLGASSDFGVALIRRVASSFDSIIAQCNRSVEKLNAATADCCEKVHIVQADLSDASQIDKLTAQLESIEKPVSHFVHLPAMPCNNTKLHKITQQEFNESLNVSLHSCFRVMQTVLPQMRKMCYGKNVVMLSNVINGAAPKYCAQYVISKYALHGLVEAAASEYIGYGITTNGISPAWTDTNYIKNQSHIIVEKSIESSPVNRLLAVDDVVPAIEFLLSSDSDMINGQNLVVSGGR